jgi:hypothetical protein
MAKIRGTGGPWFEHTPSMGELFSDRPYFNPSYFVGRVPEYKIAQFAAHDRENNQVSVLERRIESLERSLSTALKEIKRLHRNLS